MLGVLILVEPAEQGLPVDQGPSDSVANAHVSDGTASQPNRDIANVLRKTFQATIDETVPDEMLDLLAKLS